MDYRTLKIIEMRNQYATLAEIGKNFNITRERVRQILAANGLTIISRKPIAQRRADTAKQIEMLYRSGKSLKEAKEELGIPLGSSYHTPKQYYEEHRRNRFLSKVDKSGEHWYWTGCIINNYGRYNWTHNVDYAHRLLFEIETGRKPSVLIRSCDDPLCIRHWVECYGLESVNLYRDMKHRAYRKFTTEQAAKIREEVLAHPGYKLEYFAKRYNVSTAVIFRVLHRKGAYERD